MALNKARSWFAHGWNLPFRRLLHAWEINEIVQGVDARPVGTNLVLQKQPILNQLVELEEIHEQMALSEKET